MSKREKEEKKSGAENRAVTARKRIKEMARLRRRLMLDRFLLIVMFVLLSFMGFKQIPWNNITLENNIVGNMLDRYLGPYLNNGSRQAEETTAAETEAVETTTMETTTEPTTEAGPVIPDIDVTSWEFLLANPTHEIGEYAPEIAELENVELDSRIIESMTAFVAAAREAGVQVYLSSGYRDFNTQSYLFENKVSQGYSREEAATIVALPGTSEHQTGLACDITDIYRETKNKELAQTDTFQWMSAHCQEYGFIVRYPENKEDITGIIYEPWHFRYVGVEAATYIMENGLCLEEFLALYPEPVETATESGEEAVEADASAAEVDASAAEGETTAADGSAAETTAAEGSAAESGEEAVEPEV